ncbi:fasciclin domain-containing protein [Oscillatoria salina]|uniref:fasciclin domain-containing protein n=1 Tax=Oscillatoria salina TaxID=331517 RepID=UPI0013BBE6F8|nr:fasciclin domain-containing protein [Oscillatoria salina]MBZ8180731.1 fasciclin domain-containing protein [Oscillatoria salina IIICB1]NET87598.1 fasciclin domain-containing protein [Kamptonema sp. SIO1D9]
MKTTLKLRQTGKLAILTSIISLTAFVSYPANTQEVFPPSQFRSPTYLPPNQGNLLETVVNNEEFTILERAIKAAGLGDELSQNNQYTFFAPTDEAFEQLPDDIVEMLLRRENRALLQEILNYHLVKGKLSSRQLPSGGLETLSGGGVAIFKSGDEVIVNNTSVVQANIQASNGVVHAVNEVLLPSRIRASLFPVPQPSQASGNQPVRALW